MIPIPDMTFLLALTATAGLLFGGAMGLVCGRFAFVRGNDRGSVKVPLREAVARQNAVPRLRAMMPAEIAERVVASIRVNCANLYPITAEDLDDEITSWCTANRIERPCPSIVREQIALMAGVRRKRMVLTGTNPVHGYIRERLRIRGNTTSKPTLYWIDDLPDVGEDVDYDVRPAASNARPSTVRPVLTRVRPHEIHVSSRVSQPERRVAYG